MSAIGLLFVGVTLLINGVSQKINISSLPLSIINLLTGSLLLVINCVYMLQGEFYIAASGFLFTFTYLIVGICYAFSLDFKMYGIYALFVAINSVPFALGSVYLDKDPIFGVIWILWGLLWFSGFVYYVLEINILKYINLGAIFCGIFTTWLPGMLKIFDLWPY